MQFKVVAISSNTNSFGLHNVVLMSKSGEAWQVYSSDFHLPTRGQVFDFPNQNIGELVSHGWECPTQLPKAPKEVVKEVWKN
jgi:hypothetical protein